MYLSTENGYDFFTVTSLMQKSIRRGEIENAISASTELFFKFQNYVPKRLSVIVCEDTHGLNVYQLSLFIKDLQGEKDINKKIEIVKKMTFFLSNIEKSRDIDNFIHLGLMSSDYKLEKDYDINYLFLSKDYLMLARVFVELFSLKKFDEIDNFCILKSMSLNISIQKEIEALIYIKKIVQSKIKPIDRGTERDESILMVVRMAFVLCGFYGEDLNMLHNYDDLCYNICIDDSFKFPDYVFDKHTSKGKKTDNRSVGEFIYDENKSLKNNRSILFKDLLVSRNLTHLHKEKIEKLRWTNGLESMRG